jgi:hypothetical protein
LVAVRDATQAGIAVVNTPETNARSGAEHAVALMLTAAGGRPSHPRRKFRLRVFILANESKAAREYLTLIRVFEQLRALGYDGSHDAVQRYTKARQKDRAYNRRLPLRRISKPHALGSTLAVAGYLEMRPGDILLPASARHPICDQVSPL